MPLDPPLLDLFQTSTSSSIAPEIRVVLVQTSPSGKSLNLVETVPPSGTDKEDFEPTLSRVFAKEPTRSGYALYRLDTQAANGQWEWLCIAYQPDGAKVKEKMQYTMTRTSLLDGLNERHFLDTIYATNSGDFRFPAKLRNARKHDYQNPQLRTAGKPASDAAGTDAGGAKRNFGARAQHMPAPSQSSTVSPPADEPPIPESAILKDIAHAPKTGAPLDSLAESAAAGATTAGEEDSSIAPSNQHGLLPAADPSDANAARADAEKEVARKVTANTDALSTADKSISEEVQQQAEQERKAPEEPPTRADNHVKADALSQPQVPSPETARSQLGPEADQVPIAIAKPQSELEQGKRDLAPDTDTQPAAAAPPPPPAAAAPAVSDTAAAPPPRSSHPPPPSQRSSGGGSSSSPPSSFTGPKAPTWSAEAEAALTGLAQRLSGPSEHNFVNVVLTAASDNGVQVDLASPPRFIPPGDLSATLQGEIKTADGVRFAFYRYPSEVQSKRSAFMYTEAPAGSNAADKNLWANNISAVQDRASQLVGTQVQREQVGAQYGPYPRPTPAQAEEVSSRIESIRYRIDEATKQSGREKAPRLVAVSKLHPPSSIMAAYVHTGQLHFGENYVQEMVDKAKVLPPEIRWHFVGGLQSNKGKALAAIPNLYLLETLDSIKAANVLEKALASPDAAKRDEPLRVYLQVNTSGEEAKSGLPPLSSGNDDSADAPLLDLAKHVITSCPHLILQGLMTIGSAANSTDSKSSQATPDRQAALGANPDFACISESRTQLVRRIREASSIKAANPDFYTGLLQGTDSTGTLELSIGMTNDFPVAISAGSDNVRIGTACFGQRPGSREEARKGMEGELASGNASQDSAASSTSSTDKGFAKPKRPGATRK